MPLSKFEIYINTNKFSWTICLNQNSKYTKRVIRFYERYASIENKIYKSTNKLYESYASLKIKNI